MSPVRTIAPVRTRGFSLVEVLVAFAIMGLSLGVLYQTLGGSMRASAAADTRTRAVLLAESILARYPSVPPSGVQDEGVEAEFGWRISSSSVPALEGQPDAWNLHLLAVEVSWSRHGADRYRLVSIRPDVDPAVFDLNR